MPPVLRTYVGTNPAAGAEVDEVVPAGKYWRLLAVRATLVDSGVVANRQPRLIVTSPDGVTIKWHSPQANSATAGQTNPFCWGRKVGDQALNYTGLGPTLILADLVLGPGMHVKTSTALLDVGDDWGAPVLHVVEGDSLAEALGMG
jgi:hypothetical protein